MNAFVERLCEHAGIVRAGPYAKKYGDPYDYSTAYLVQGDLAIIKALVTDGRLTHGHARAIIRALKDIGLRATWERIK